MRRVIAWLREHLVVRTRDLNKTEERERIEDRQPHRATEVLLKWEF